MILYSDAKTPGRLFLEKLAPLDRKHSGFTGKDASGAMAWRLPATWEGEQKGSPEGSIVATGGKPVWKLEQIWPPEPRKPGNYRAMIWNGTEWNVGEGGFGGQPSAALKDNALQLKTRAPHGQPPQRRVCALVFVAPETGSYRLSGTASARIWEGKNKMTLRLLRKNASDAAEAGSLAIAPNAAVPLDGLGIQLNAGDELVLLPEIDGMFNGGELTLRDLAISRAP